MKNEAHVQEENLNDLRNLIEDWNSLTTETQKTLKITAYSNERGDSDSS